MYVAYLSDLSGRTIIIIVNISVIIIVVVVVVINISFAAFNLQQNADETANYNTSEKQIFVSKPELDFSSKNSCPESQHLDIPSHCQQTVDTPIRNTLPFTSSHVSAESRQILGGSAQQPFYVLPSMLQKNNPNTPVSPAVSPAVSAEPFVYLSYCSLAGTLASEVKPVASVVSSPGYGGSSAAFNGQYQPVSSGQHQSVSSGQYQPVSSGQQQPIFTGKYQPVSSGQHQSVSSGQYQPVSSGQYQPVSSGLYQPTSSGQYQPVSSGLYQPGTQSGRHALSAPPSVFTCHSLFCSTSANSFPSYQHAVLSAAPTVQPTASHRSGGGEVREPLFVSRSRPRDYVMVPGYNQDVLSQLQEAMKTIENVRFLYVLMFFIMIKTTKKQHQKTL